MKDCRIRILIMDVDGTLTDGKIYMGAHGEIMKAFDVKDGYAITGILPEYGIVPAVLTARSSDIVRERCRELHILEIHQGCLDKQGKLYELADKYGLPAGPDGTIHGMAYIGDDMIDIPAMKISEASGCPLDAAEEVKAVSDYVCRNKGGKGAVREFVQWLVKAQQI